MKDTLNPSKSLEKLSGIYLVKPHAEKIWSGEKKIIVKSKEYPEIINHPLFYMDNEFCYGIIKLKEPKKISLQEFEKMSKEHQITKEEKSNWWDNKEEFYAYDFEILDSFENPKPVDLKSGTQTFVKDVHFLETNRELSEPFEFYEVEEDIYELGAFASSGGKTRIADQLLALTPVHKTYVEPFAGGAALYWKKQPSELDVLNDKNADIAYAYKFIRDSKDSELNALRVLDWSADKEKFFRLRDAEAPQDLAFRFYRFFYILHYSYGANLKSWGYKTANIHILEKIPKLRDRMKNTKIYSQDYLKVMRKYNSSDTFIYLDPPYPQEWAGPEGKQLFTKDNVQEMHDFLKNEFKGKFLLSINDLGWIRKIFSDFKVTNIKVPRSFKYRRNEEGKLTKYYKNELLILNYELAKTFQNAETGSSDIAGAPVSGGGLQPIAYPKKKGKIKRIEKIDLIEDVNEYDPSDADNKALLDDWIIVNDWYSTYKESDGKGINHSRETIINIAKLIYDEIVKRVKEGTIKHEFDTKGMKPNFLEIYDIVSSGKVINNAEWSDLGFIDHLKDFTVIKDAISLIGSSVSQDHKPNDIDLLIKMDKPESDFLRRSVEIRVTKMMPEELKNKIHFVWGEKEGPHDKYIPIFDLTFRKIESSKAVDMDEETNLDDNIELMKPYLPQKPAGSAYYDLNKFMDALK